MVDNGVRYVVRAPLLVIRDPHDGSNRYLYAGAVVPTDVDAGARERLVDRGLIEAVSSSLEDGPAGDEVPVNRPKARRKPARRDGTE